MELTRHQRRKDRIKVGIPFGSPKILHHHVNGELIICENAAEHGKLEREKRAIEAGAEGKEKCVFCQKYDDIENLVISKAQVYHRTCQQNYNYYRNWEIKHGRPAPKLKDLVRTEVLKQILNKPDKDNKGECK